MTTREQILEQVEALLNTISGLHAVYRNRGELPREDLPAAVLLDGRGHGQMPIRRLKSVKMPPTIMTMSPQIWIATEPRDDATNMTLNGAPAPIGPELSMWEQLVLNAIVNDPTLIALLTAEGQIEYKGFETDMAIGSSMTGQLAMFFELTYVLMPPRS